MTPELKLNARFTKSNLGFITGFGAIYQFRTISEIGLPKAMGDYADFFKSSFLTIADEAAKDGNVVASEGFFKEPNFSKYMSVVMDNSMKGTMQFINCVSLVFGHALLDSYILDLICISKDCDLNSFCDLFGKERKIALNDVLHNSMENIIADLATKIFYEFDRKSLLQKTEILYKICSPPKEFSGIKGFKFDCEKIEAIDNIRHNIVHKPDLNYPIENIIADLSYLMNTGMYFFSMTHKRFDLKVVFDPSNGRPIMEV